MCNKKIFFFNFLVLLFFNVLHAQNQKKIDSLENSISKKQNDTSLVNNYNLLAKECYRVDIKKTSEINEKIWLLSKKNNFKKGIAHFYLNKSYIGLFTHNNEQAILNGQKASEIYLKVKDTSGYLNSRYSIAIANTRLKKPHEAIEIARTAINFSKSKNFNWEIGKLNYSLGENYHSLYNIKKSLLHFNLALSNYRKSKVKDNLIIIICYFEIAEIYRLTDQLDKALEFTNAAIKVIKDNPKYSYQITEAYNTLASIYIDKKDFKKALKYAQIAIDKYDSKLNTNETLLVCNYFLSKINFELKNYDKSIENSKKVISLADYEEHKINANQILGCCYFAKSLINKAPDYNENGSNLIKHERLSYLKKAHAFQKTVINYIDKSIDKSGVQATFSSIYEEIAKTENALGNYKKAYEYSLINKQINDKILNEEKTDRINELQTSFEVSEKEIALKNSLFDKQKKDIEIQKQNNYITKISAILLTTILVALILIGIYFINKKKNTQLQSKNGIIEKTNTELSQSKIKLEKLLSEKDVLLKEIHHRVKNNLQIIISLLNIQSRSDKNISTDEFIERSLTRITSMSLVHQNLYQNENVDKVDFNEYLNNLTQSITNSFNETKGNVKVKITCQDIFLQIETAIPLGLIINELMYNMYKHAFPESSSGIINIKLKKLKTKYQLTIKDNGVGFDEEKDCGKSMGLKLVKLLSSQINGTFEKIKSEKTEFLIEFSETNKDSNSN